MDARASRETPFIGVAGKPATEQEMAYVKQAVFLLRFRIKFHPAPEPVL